MRAALEATPRGPAPDLDTIAARLGGFSSASDGSATAPARAASAGAGAAEAVAGAMSLWRYANPAEFMRVSGAGAAGALGADGALRSASGSAGGSS